VQTGQTPTPDSDTGSVWLSTSESDNQTMPVIECDVTTARERLEDAGVEISPGNTDHERWRVDHADGTAVAYDGKVVLQGAKSTRLAGLLREESGRVHVYSDGASRGNPGPAAVGWVLVSGDGIVTEGGERIGETTNNRAEYEAFVRALAVARDYGFDEVEARSDSELLVRQVTGEWETNDPGLRECRVRARELLAAFDDWTLSHVPREVNERADELANEAFEDE
jgi:ribonuclease HI